MRRWMTRTWLKCMRTCPPTRANRVCRTDRPTAALKTPPSGGVFFLHPILFCALPACVATAGFYTRFKLGESRKMRVSGTEGTVHARLLHGVAFALILLPILLSGCKRDSDGQLPAASGEKIQARREAVQGFGLVAAYPDQKEKDELAIALEFSRPLVGTQEFDQLVAITDKNGAPLKGSWVLDGDNAKILRFPHVGASNDYVVTIKGGLTAADGDRLSQEIKRNVYTGPLDPVVGFASQGSVLPARESRGLPVVSINVPEVDVEFLRVREKELPKFFSEYQRGGRRGSWELEQEW